VTGDRGRARYAREVGFLVDAGPLDQVFCVGAVDDDVARVHAGNPDATDRRAVGCVRLGLASEVFDAAALVGEAGEGAALDRRGRRVFGAAQLAAQMVLLQQGVQRRDRLLPDERDDRVHERQGAENDQRDRRATQRPRRGRTAVIRAWDACGGRWSESEL
jgi:hypothetical protein